MNPVVGVALRGSVLVRAEAVLAFVAGWPLSWRSPVAWFTRDVVLPFLWVRGWSGRNVIWRGNAMDVDEGVFVESEPRAQV